MTLKKLPTYCQELLSLQSIFLSLGFKPDDLFVTRLDSGAAVVIRKDGDAYQFHATDISTGKTDSEFAGEWTIAAATWNNSSRQEKMELVESSSIRQYAVGIIATLSAEKLLPEGKFDFICPFCNGKAQADQSKFSISHSSPICAKFAELKPAEYLASLRHLIN